MKRSGMGIAAIISGIILIIAGIAMISSKSDTPADRPAATPRPVSPAPVSGGTSSPAAGTDDSRQKGADFEDFVINLLADWRLELLDRTQDAVSSAGVAATSSGNPDLHVRQKRGNGHIDYYLECKYRSHWGNGEVNFEEWQLDRYRRFQRDSHRKVLIALGVGGTAAAPDTFMLVPLDSIKGNSIKKIRTRFVCQPDATSLVEYMDAYFTTVFSKARKKKADTD